ncbi:EF-hand domain-containing protein [Sphingomonas sp. CJ99]
MAAILIALLLTALQDPAAGQRGAMPAPESMPMPRASMMAEPLALFLVGCDADRDAVVTRAELDACAQSSLLPHLDRDGMAAGYLSFGDWAERHLGDRNALPSPFGVDTDGDNRITPAEFAATLTAAFARMDRDSDGRLTRAELLTIRTTAGPGGPGRPRSRRR